MAAPLARRSHSERGMTFADLLRLVACIAIVPAILGMNEVLLAALLRRRARRNGARS